MSTLSLYFLREWKLMFRNTSSLIQPLVFFVIIALLFPFSLPAESALLQKIGGGVIWVSAVLATLLSLESMFYTDYIDGSLEQALIHPRSVTLAMLGKVLAQWTGTGLILSCFSPLLCLTFNIPSSQIWVLFASLILGTPSLTLIGAIGAALTVTLRRGGVLIAIIILPLYIPILIFGAGTLTQAAQGLPIAGQLYALAAILALALTLAPFAIAGALRVTIE
ncbi:heme exporter protein CcmB [Arenicella xantha]|uniref:Heme exporter protein B n=1 Tax=Arenicella xantha TaxID=644221 RepID=A0A395JI74_9GAMM|nr:heme exporter protein CcmB [Arenicella xantha]RBP48604.1 heme exporter protein B [Arenicella xantha]